MSGWKPFLATLALAGTASAQPTAMKKAEAAQLYAAGGFPIQNDHPTNSCGKAANPRITFVDISGDRRPEALFIDENTACYGGAGRYFAIAGKDAAGRWQSVLRGTGTVQAIASRTNGWLDMTVSDRGCVRPYRYDGARYEAAGGCGARIAAAPAAPPARAAASPPAPSAAPKGAANEDAAIFRAANAQRIAGGWSLCADDPQREPASIDWVRDLNGDGRPEAIILQGGTFCYGHTGAGYALVSKQADGSWRAVPGASGQGIPNVLATKGAGGWPDIELGGPGFCFAVWRWNGREYDVHRFQYEGKPCRLPQP